MLSSRRRHVAGSRRQRRCEDFAPKAEVIGKIPIPDDVPARANSGQLFLAQQTSAFWCLLQHFANCVMGWRFQLRGAEDRLTLFLRRASPEKMRAAFSTQAKRYLVRWTPLTT